eukprot:CAMPEP_0197857388 /NCGR_PEP_ID=MMETSP1438-20131217/30378_1 /TAXON_ID=1461541 /ORGANISM="Pterosperma sp., Strain CCMP1384" /LENGTH=519 /DNA_ID=CAMNT_0043473199 /DNA_START=113 /DNA_END=1672 /DNA_ORIENTATION=+
MSRSTGFLLLVGIACAHAAIHHSHDNDLFIKGGTTVSTSDECISLLPSLEQAGHCEGVRDILIQGGKITKFEKPGVIEAPEGAYVIDASGKYVFPGGIDPHTHLEMPFMGQQACDDFQSGQEAALAGGTTFHIDFALPVNGDILAGHEMYKEKAAKSVMDYGFHMAITTWNDKMGADMKTLADRGINSFKFFLAYKGALMVTDEQFIAGMQVCKDEGLVAMVHAENGDAVAVGQKRMIDAGITGPEGHPLSRPAILEGEATGRAIRLANFTGAPLYVVHVMSIDAMEEVERARERGMNVIGETVASAITQEESKVWDPDFKIAAQYVMSPPIRSAEHRDKVKAGLATGKLQLIATDHAVFNSTQKEAGKPPKGDFRVLPNGVNGIEERIHVTWSTMVNGGMISPSRFVSITSTEAAKIFNVYPQKGHLDVGSDADMYILDPAIDHTIKASSHHSRMDTNIYEDMEVHGKVTTTISQGKVVWENDKLFTTRGAGRFVPMEPFGPYLFPDHASNKAVKDEL